MLNAIHCEKVSKTYLVSSNAPVKIRLKISFVCTVQIENED